MGNSRFEKLLGGGLPMARGLGCRGSRNHPRQFALSTRKPRFGRGFLVPVLRQLIVIATVRIVRLKKRLTTLAFLFDASYFDAELAVCLPAPYVVKLDSVHDDVDALCNAFEQGTREFLDVIQRDATLEKNVLHHSS